MTNNAFKENNFKELLKTDPERQKAIAAAGGKASGESKRKRKAAGELYGALMDAAFTMDFATPEELKAFRKWRQTERSNNNGKRKHKE